jgi:hypothetical protein
MPKVQLTIREAEDAIRRVFTATRFRGELRYDPAKVIESPNWRYIPYTWIGCKGFIVSREDLYVNWLGSALSLEECFWGQEHGIVNDLVDFAFAAETNISLATTLVSRFKHMHPNAKGVVPGGPVWYRSEEVSSAVAQQFPLFKRHYAWFCIPDLMIACQGDKLQFTCSPCKTGALG